MDDLISRQAAVDAIEEYADRLQMVNWEENPGVPYKAHALNWAINTLRDLPSAERTGRWVKGDEMADYPRVPYKSWETYCSCCGAIKEQSNDGFCGNCGARMEEGE